jgi:hypothetical protein
MRQATAEILSAYRVAQAIGWPHLAEVSAAAERVVAGPSGRSRPWNDKAPPCGAFASCAEEDSNLHPVIADQALNLATRVSHPSEPTQIDDGKEQSHRSPAATLAAPVTQNV